MTLTRPLRPRRPSEAPSEQSHLRAEEQRLGPTTALVVDHVAPADPGDQTAVVQDLEVVGALVLFDSVYTDGDGAVPLAIIITWTYERGEWRVLVDQNTVVG